MLKRLPFPLCLCALSIHTSMAAMEFDLTALEFSGKQKDTLDIARLRSIDQVLPGVYSVDLILNGRQQGTEQITFELCNEQLCPTFNLKRLSELGVDVTRFPDLGPNEANLNIRIPSRQLPGVEMAFEASRQRLTLTVPQQYMKTVIRDDVPVSDWDDGIPALYSSWNISGQRASFQQGASNDNYLNLNSGANYGGWRLRNTSYYTENDGVQSWRSVQSYLSHDVRALRSQAYLGQYTTAGRVFNAFNFRGAMIVSNSQMLPDSQRGYAPVVRGVAFSQSKVEIRQQGNLLYQTFVPPGPFEITDLYPTGNGGDLEVTVQEASGKMRQYLQPFATVPVMVRENQFKYSLVAGKYDNADNNARQDSFVQVEFAYGVLNNTTIYGGALGAEPYRHVIAGIGQGLGLLGSVSADFQFSRVRDTVQNSGGGKAWHLQYQKQFEATNTLFSMSWLNYHDRAFRTFEQFENAGIRADNASFYQQQDVRNRYQLSVSQPLGKWGALALSGFRQTGFSDSNNNTSYNASYSFPLAAASVSLSWSKAVTSYGNSSHENIYGLNVSIPLGKLTGGRDFGTSQVSFSAARSEAGMAQYQTTLSGTALRDNNLSYAIAQSNSRNGQGASRVSSRSADMSYDGRYGSVSLGLGQTDGESKRLNYGARGSLLVHPYGVTLGQEISQKNTAFALVQAPGVSGVSVINKWGVSTNRDGYALVPYLQPYRYNDIQLDPLTLPDNAELNTTAVRQVPTQGAVLLSRFETSVGEKAYIRLVYGGTSLPFGTEVESSDGGQGIVDDRGYAWISGLKGDSRLTAKLAKGTCNASFRPENLTNNQGIFKGTLQCL